MARSVVVIAALVCAFGIPIAAAADTTSCPCTKELHWVCGKDGNTYANPCLLKCAGTKLAYEGRCADPSGCDNVRCITEYDPVCGFDGVEYQNECFAICTGVSYTPGPCRKRHSTKASGGRGRHGPGRRPHKAGRGPSPAPERLGKVGAEQCAHCGDDISTPVCGADGITYGSLCLAQCSGVAVADPSAGPCP